MGDMSEDGKFYEKRESEWVEGVPEGRGSFKNGSRESPRERLADGESVSYADVIRTPGRKASTKAPRQELSACLKKSEDAGGWSEMSVRRDPKGKRWGAGEEPRAKYKGEWPL